MKKHLILLIIGMVLVIIGALLKINGNNLSKFVLIIIFNNLSLEKSLRWLKLSILRETNKGRLNLNLKPSF